MIFTSTDIQCLGLSFVGFERGRKTEETIREEFHKHYGSSSTVLAHQWNDLILVEELPLSKLEKTERGVKRFLMAHFWLWTKPKNASVLASRFKICKDYCCGQHFYLWLERINLLYSKKVFIDERILADGTEILAFTADGVDFSKWEISHPLFPQDNTACSHKMKHCAAKYVILLATYQSQILHIEGPCKGGVNDSKMLKESGIMEKLKANNKVCIVDRGFHMTEKEFEACLSFPDLMDSKELHSHKTRARLRQETFNARLKAFAVLCHTFPGSFEKHSLVLKAVAITIQYQMDHGSPLYEV